MLSRLLRGLLSRFDSRHRRYGRLRRHLRFAALLPTTGTMWQTSPMAESLTRHRAAGGRL